MAKQIEDIIPSEKKSIRDIPIPESRRKNLNLIDNSLETSNRSQAPVRNPEPIQNFNRSDYEKTAQVISDIRQVETPPPASIPREAVPNHRDYSPSESRKRLPKKPFILGGVIILIILALGVFSLFSGATVSYTPKNQSLTFNNETFTAKKEGTTEDLLFSVIKLTEEKSTEAPASGEEEVSQKASGIIIIYNNSSPNSQRLIKTTRFETPDGKIYRIANDVTVPGQKTLGGQTQPGSIEVTVYADQPGESFNIGLSDFTLPGLKGDPKFQTIYARSKTPMTGGLVGTVKKVSAEDKKSAETSIEASLKESLIAEATVQVPADFVLIPSLVQITYEKLPEGASTGEKAVVRERGNFSGVIFKKTDLIRYLASKKTTVTVTDQMDADLNSLNISFIEVPTEDLAQEDTITFAVTGDTMVVWISDESAIAQELRGKDKDELKQVLNNYPSIIEADAVVRPFWKKSFPNETENIKFIKSIK
jgi:hypothetical protein